MADTSTDSSSGFDWGSLLNTVVSTGGAVLKSDLDKPISNAATPQPTNQNSSPTNTAQAVATAKATPATNAPTNYTPYVIGVGLLALAVYLLKKA